MTSEAKVQSDDVSTPGVCSSAEFAAQFEEVFRKLWLIAVGISRDSALADDIVQEAAIVALAKLDQYRRGTNFGAWMAQTVRYVALNQIRKEHRRRAQPLDETTGAIAPSESERESAGETLELSARGIVSADRSDFDDRMVAALGAVSETARACLLLRTIEGLDYREISAVLDIPEGTAMSHVHRARRTMRERLSAESPTVTKKEAR